MQKILESRNSEFLGYSDGTGRCARSFVMGFTSFNQLTQSLIQTKIDVDNSKLNLSYDQS